MTDADDYHPQLDSARCYDAAIRAIRHRMIRDGVVIPYDGEQVDIVLMAVVADV